jgi:esterase
MTTDEPSAPERTCPSGRSLRFQGFPAAYERLTQAAAHFGLAPADVLLPAEGMLAGADGLVLHYLEWPGPITDPLVVFLHGGGLQAHCWDVVGLRLRHRARCVALDLRGHGDSDHAQPGQYGTPAIARDLEAVLPAFAASRVVIVGHSLGGLGAITYAQRNPPELAGLVIIDVGPEISTTAGHNVHRLISAPMTFGSIEEAESFIRATVPGAQPPRRSNLIDNLTWNAKDQLTWKHDTQQFSITAGPIDLGSPLLRMASRIRAPTLIVRGERSKVFSDTAAADLAEAMPNASWAVVRDAGHTIQSSNPLGLADLLSDFLITRLAHPAPDPSEAAQWL